MKGATGMKNRRQSALERRIVNISKYTTEIKSAHDDVHKKALIAKQDIENLLTKKDIKVPETWATVLTAYNKKTSNLPKEAPKVFEELDGSKTVLK
jgi:hypothetical protein